MKKIILALLLVLALVTTSEGQRRISGVQRGGPSGAGDPLRTPTGGGSGSSPASGPAPGTLLLGTNNLTTSADDVNANTNTAYPMCAVGQATATVTTAYFYDNIGAETDPVHICIWNSSGTLLGCSGNITMTGSVGWRSVAWSGPSITATTNYLIGVISGTSTGFWTKYDSTSPSMIATEAVAMTFGSEGNLSSPSCSEAYGSWAIYVTN